MEEPSLRTSKLALAGGLAAILLVGGGGFLLGRGTTQRETIVAPPVPVVAKLPQATPPTPDETPEEGRGVLTRSDLIALAAAAADAASGGRPATPQIAANGRRFEVRLPFGCGGPAEQGSAAPMLWRYDRDEEVLRVSVSPTVWTPADWATSAERMGGAEPLAAEAVEGFWIARSWSSAEACPAVTAQPQVTGTEPVTLPGQTLALAQFFAADTRQDRRADRPFQTSKRIAAADFDAGQGLRLRLSGRIDTLSGRGPVLCRQPGGPEQRPICVIAVTIGEVGIELATGETLATWNLDRPNAPTS